MSIRIAVLSDLCSKNGSDSYREFAELVFLRTVHYLNDFIRPDLLCITGSSERLSPKQISAVQEYAEKLNMPCINADGTILSEKYSRNKLKIKDFTISVMRKTDSVAHLTAEDKNILLYAEPQEFSATEVAECKVKNGILNLLPAGSVLPGQDNGILFFEVPALDIPPYRFAILTISDSGEISVETEQYLLPPGLMDTHVHTKLAYCSENMDIEPSLKLAQLWGLKKIAFTEHSGHLYFTLEQYWSKESPWFMEGLACKELTERTEEYYSLLADVSREHCLMGMEIDVDQNGKCILRQTLLDQLEIRIGAIHTLSAKEPQEKEEQFYRIVKSLMESGIDILAHPFRVYSWDGIGEKPVHLFEKVVRLLKQNGVAAEINFHHNRPDPVFTKMCIDAGVKIALGSDSHNLYEVGYFQPHLKFLKEIGYHGDLSKILWQPTRQKHTS